ncbi:MAG: membrane protein insertase YidC [Bacteroidetes bacterium]|nr:membrane protein insertase YidC [Bacteroidota bacterium]
MDRNAVIGFILIAVLFVVWMFMTTPSQEELQQQERQRQELANQEAAKNKNNADVNADAPPPRQEAAATDSANATAEFSRFGMWFNHLGKGQEETFVIETEKYEAVFTSRGGSIKRWRLKGFETWNEKPLQLIDWERSSDYNVVFSSSDGRFINTKDLYFQFENVPTSRRIVLEDTASWSFKAILPVRGDSIAMVKHFTVHSGGFTTDLDIEMRNMADVLANFEYQVTLHSPAHTERNSVEEATFSETDVMVNGTRESFDADDTEVEKSTFDGETEWIVIKNKYFLNALMVRDGFMGTGVYLEGRAYDYPEEGKREIYEAGLKVKYRGESSEISRFTIYIGPLDYDILADQYKGMEQVLSLGWEFVVRPFSEYLVMPLFSFLHSFIPNYGVVIIIFSILIKLLLYPLTKTSMASMQRMQKLQPLMTEIREKYKDDQQKQNVETMKLYKDYGVNPAGGCLPMLLQMPILFALFSIFRSTIELRHQPFVSWINDLSAPDILVTLPFKIPLLGMSFISGLALMMAVTMFVQQKMTIKDPRQKSMVYMMPVMFWILFNSFPSGLNLYYFMFNLLSIGQQHLINKRHQDEPLVRVTPKDGKKKQSWTDRAMASMQEKAKEQQKPAKKKKQF